jgi:superfamily II DNA helicase RecQ
MLRLLYVAPEKLAAGPVMACLRRMSPLPLVCVDEAHCMAEWGQGFRPAYFRLVSARLKHVDECCI